MEGVNASAVMRLGLPDPAAAERQAVEDALKQSDININNTHT